MKKTIVIGLLILSAPLLGAFSQAGRATYTYYNTPNYKSYAPAYNYAIYKPYQYTAPTTGYRNYSWLPWSNKQEQVPTPSEQTRQYYAAFNKYQVYGGPKPSPTITIPAKTWTERLNDWWHGTQESKVNTELFPRTKEAPTFEPYLNKGKNRSWWE